MPRKRQYKEDEVIEKAMNLFWKNGYEATSMQMLEKEMGINKFSIYSSFGSKNGVFLESINCYRKKLSKLTNKLEASGNGTLGLKAYFYDFIQFARETNFGKGCLVTNTANEINEDADPRIKAELTQFTNKVRSLFAQNLKQDPEKGEAEVEAQADYLLIAMVGLSSATRIFPEAQLSNYIENIFRSI